MSKTDSYQGPNINYGRRVSCPNVKTIVRVPTLTVPSPLIGQHSLTLTPPARCRALVCLSEESPNMSKIYSHSSSPIRNRKSSLPVSKIVPNAQLKYMAISETRSNAINCSLRSPSTLLDSPQMQSLVSVSSVLPESPQFNSPVFSSPSLKLSSSSPLIHSSLSSPSFPLSFPLPKSPPSSSPLLRSLSHKRIFMSPTKLPSVVPEDMSELPSSLPVLDISPPISNRRGRNDVRCASETRKVSFTRCPDDYAFVNEPNPVRARGSSLPPTTLGKLHNVCDRLKIQSCANPVSVIDELEKKRRSSMIVPMPSEAIIDPVKLTNFTLGVPSELANRNPRMSFRPGSWNPRTGKTQVILRLEVNIPQVKPKVPRPSFESSVFYKS